ncbi:hypothetical protein HEN20_006435 [Escherichia coli]|nr:hypothetical protein [Escherichia coli]
MEKAAKATFSCYSCKAFFCEAASGLLLFQRIANFDFRLFTQVTHQSFKLVSTVVGFATEAAASAL